MIECQAFLESLSKTRFLAPDGQPASQWQLFSGSTFEEASSVTFEAIAKVKLSGAWIPTEQRIAKAVDRAARGNFFAVEEVRDSAHAAVERALQGAPQHELRRAKRDAGALATLLFVADKEFKTQRELTELAQACWAVWQKGYCLYSDVKDVLYVYYKK